MKIEVIAKNKNNKRDKECAKVMTELVKHNLLKDEVLIEGIDLLIMHNLGFHIPIRHYGYENGTRVLIKEVHRKKEGCIACDKLYKNLPVPSNVI
jgi:hypothetical protein